MLPGLRESVGPSPVPERPIGGGMVKEALLAHVLLSKYSNHLPLYSPARV
jgi:transposase